MPMKLSYLNHIADDKEVGKDAPLLSHCKQCNDPGECQYKNKDEYGLKKTPAVKQLNIILIEGKLHWYDIKIVQTI